MMRGLGVYTLLYFNCILTVHLQLSPKPCYPIISGEYLLLYGIVSDPQTFIHLLDGLNDIGYIVHPLPDVLYDFVLVLGVQIFRVEALSQLLLTLLVNYTPLDAHRVGDHLQLVPQRLVLVLQSSHHLVYFLLQRLLDHRVLLLNLGKIK